MITGFLHSRRCDIDKFKSSIKQTLYERTVRNHMGQVCLGDEFENRMFTMWETDFVAKKVLFKICVVQRTIKHEKYA